ncbi:MAG: N-acetylmuramoyl-L-alanine amidase [Clostridia bacterium]|nr:N-acetylmuramoyl-L-alanine amidase [Clostridia bacterium]
MKEFAVIISLVLIFSFCVFLGVEKTKNNILSVVAEERVAETDFIVILDAGHGGEDSGAVAVDGTLEKDLNLAVAECVSSYFDIFGIEYVMIRSEDISVGDTSLETIRQRKVSDIKKRYEIINSYDNSVLLSIHQNNFPVEKYSGTQVFYAPSDEESEVLAGLIQSKVVNALQPGNHRKVKASDDSIYILYNAKRPSVLVECGFLSNEEELVKLKEAEYQSQISYFISSSVLNYINNYKE